MPIPNRQWQNYKEQNEREGVLLIPVPPEYARWEVEQARAINAQTGLDLGEHLEAWDRIFGAGAGGYQPPDELARARSMSQEERDAALGHLGCLLHLGPFQSWSLEPADCQPWREEWEKVTADEAEPGENDAAADAVLAQIAREKISPEERRRYRDRLVEVSRKLRWHGMEHEADTAAAVALQIEEASDPGEIELFRALAANGLDLLKEILEDGEDPEELRYDPMAPIEEDV
jgi:hypothetical protein